MQPPATTQAQRSQWGSRLGFILAAAGSAVGLGNIWKFPYVTGENGGGVFVLIYLGAVLLVGIPIMVAEILLGRRGQGSPPTALRRLAGERSAWQLLGWLGVATGFVILSYYAVVAGWALDYLVKSLTGAFWGVERASIPPLFDQLYSDGPRNVLWLAVFLGLTLGVVIGGVQQGIERWNRILMPALFLLLLALLANAARMEGFGRAMHFLFWPDLGRFKGGASVLEAVGQGFFSLSLGMGAMLTYGSYLKRDADLLRSALIIALLDTLVALLAACILFPIIFSFGFAPQAGPGLVFKTLPVVFAQLPAGRLLAVLFFLLLVFAALTSAVSLLEVVAAALMERLRWPRRRAVWACSAVIFLFGLPSALSGSQLAGLELLGKRNVFDSLDYLASNWALPLGGIGIALFVGWRLDRKACREEYEAGSAQPGSYPVWRQILRFVSPVAVAFVFLKAVGLI